MANSNYVFRVNVAGKNPIVSGDKRLTLRNVISFFMGILNGQRASVGNVTVRAEHTPVAATGTVTAAAVQAADTVSINGQALTATTHTARGTVTCTAANTDVDDTLVVGAVTLTAKNTENTASGHFNISGTNAAMATSIAACIAANATLAALVKTVVASNVVHIKALATGAGGNSIVLTSSDADGIAVSGAGTLAGGAAVANNQFDFHAQFNDDTATALAAAVNATTTDAINDWATASAASAVVTVTASEAGSQGNTITLASSNGTRLAIGGGATRLTGGTETSASFTF